MKLSILYVLPILLLGCNGAKKEAQKDSLEIQAQQKQIDSLKASVNSITSKEKKDSVRKSKLAFWRKQKTLMTVNIYADEATIGKAKQRHRGRSPIQRKRAIEQANTQLVLDRKRLKQVSDSLRKYQD